MVTINDHKYGHSRMYPELQAKIKQKELEKEEARWFRYHRLMLLSAPFGIALGIALYMFA